MCPDCRVLAGWQVCQVSYSLTLHFTVILYTLKLHSTGYSYTLHYTLHFTLLLHFTLYTMNTLQVIITFYNYTFTLTLLEETLNLNIKQPGKEKKKMKTDWGEVKLKQEEIPN